MNPYQYPPLSGPRCTRVIRLHPGATKDPSCPLSCDLEEIDLDNPPEYLALSYTWNGETPSEPLTIGDAQGDTSPATGSQLLITPNCAAALRAFRKSLHRRINMRKHLTLWVDAICINQGSNDDKSTQVDMMAEIFEHAKRVVVWLGNEDSPTSPRLILCSLACVLLPDEHIGRLKGFFKWTERSKALKWFNPRFERLKELAADAILKGESRVYEPVMISYNVLN
ncbi:HET domain-containing protein [Colletotrichum camelliae]|nr:HET domain-containing protein [Colletotrichum camelliae]